jgi:hypothetical protein
LASTRFEKLINVKDRGQIFRVEVASIERIDAAGDYMCIYTTDNSLILRETMKLDMPDGVYRMLKRALGKFDLAMIVIKELRDRSERYQERDLKERAGK